MELIKKICKDYFKDIEFEQEDSVEYAQQEEKCSVLYEELSASLNAEQKKRLCILDTEYFSLSAQWNIDGFNEGTVKGFKLAIRLILDSLSDK